MNAHKQQLIQACMDLEHPQSQQMLNYIKKALGSLMMEQDRSYHIQYSHGVQLNLSCPVFDDVAKLREMIAFAQQLRAQMQSDGRVPFRH